MNARVVGFLHVLADRALEKNAINRTLALNCLAIFGTILRFRALKKAQRALEICVNAAIDALADQKRAVREAAHRSLEAWASRRDDVYGVAPSKRRRRDENSTTSATQRCSGLELVLPAVPPSLRKKPAVRGSSFQNPNTRSRISKSSSDIIVLCAAFPLNTNK